MNLSDFAGKLRITEKEKDTFFLKTVNHLSGRVLRGVRKKTPVDTGTLRARWSVQPVIKIGKRYRAVVLNNVKYAPYIEYGHRTVGENPSWVKGFHMLQLTHNQVNRQAGAIIRRRFHAFLEGHLQ